MYLRVRIKVEVKVVSRVRFSLGIKGQGSELSVGKIIRGRKPIELSTQRMKPNVNYELVTNNVSVLVPQL